MDPLRAKHWRGGAFPIAGLVDANGTLYGDTTESGDDNGAGPGIVFAFRLHR